MTRRANQHAGTTEATGSPTTTSTPSTVSNRHDNLHDMLRWLNLSHMSATFAETALQAAKANLSHETFLYKLAAPECAYWR